MSNTGKIEQISSVLFYLTLQLAIPYWLGLHSFGYFIYIAPLLLFPHQYSRLTTFLLFAFLLGAGMDAWHHTSGMHAFATVLTVYIRAQFLSLIITSNSRNESVLRPSPSSLGWIPFSCFILFFVVVHHCTVLVFDMSIYQQPLVALRKLVLSSAFTHVTMCVTQLLTSRPVTKK